MPPKGVTASQPVAGCGSIRPGTTIGMPSAAEALLEEADELLAGWRRRYAGRPDLERHHVLLLALQREQLGPIAYREDALVETVALLPIGPEMRAIVRQCMAWIWKDEEMHATLI